MSQSSAIYYVLAGVLGLCLGSFLNVVIYRLPKKISLNDPKRSICPKCDHHLSAIELIPVLSWVGLRRRCRHCHEPIPVRYPLVELATAGVLEVIVWRFGADLFALAWCVLGVAMVALFVIDAETNKLPRQIIYAGGIPAVIISAVEVSIHGAWDRLGWAAALGFGLFLLFYLLARFSRGMGMGDVRLIGFLTAMMAMISPLDVAYAVALSFVVASLFGIPVMIVHPLKSKARIPLGPFLIVGYLSMALIAAPVHF